jgi:dihydrofolate reductase
MAKTLYSVTMSLDGCIAGAGGDMSWMTEHLGPDPTVEALIPEVGSLLVGHTTFRGDDPNAGQEGEGEAFGGGWEGQQIVLTHHIPEEQIPGITFVDDFDEALRLAKAAAGEGYVNILGASVAKQVLEAGELDEVLTFIAPVLLGDGTRLFEHDGGTNVRLERIRLAETPLATCLWYRVVGTS